MKLMHELLKARMRPYYIYMADQVAGGEHFRTTVQKGLGIIQALRGWTSGLAVPQFAIDAPGGGAKVPLLPMQSEQSVRFSGKATSWPFFGVQKLSFGVFRTYLLDKQSNL